ncbi:MAG TPA: GNAT family N-acetyltransferase [Abditibacteriaceae bacterium]|jgi:putative acetyltransferase
MVIIRPIQRDEVEAAKQVIETVCLEFFGHAPHDFEDMDDIRAQYSGDSGIFLVLADNNKIVGTGAIRRIDNYTCELKRMWFLQEYRGRGFGKEMAQSLLKRARQMGYKRVRLDTSPELVQATGLYVRLGFQPIERYNDGPCSLFMEMTL